MDDLTKLGFIEINSHPIIEFISPQFVTNRLDVDYYRPEYLKLDEQLKKTGYRQERMTDLSKIINDGPGGWSLQSSEYVKEGVPLIRIVDFRNNLDPLGMIYISPAKHDELLRYEVLPGDVLITAAGSIGEAQILPESVARANFRDLIRIRLKPGTDPYYVSAYLNSKYGRMITRRFAHGAVQLHLKVYDAKEISVVVPDSKIQSYIGDKVHLAEKCRSEATILFTEAQTIFSNAARQTEFIPKLASSNIIQSKQVTDRLTPEFHLPRYYDLEIHLASLDWPIRPIGDLVREPIIRISSPTSDNIEGYPCILTSDIEPYFIEWEKPSLWISPEEHRNWRGALQPNDVVYTSIGPPVGEAAIVLQAQLPMAIGGDVSLIRTNQKLQPGYLTLYLNSIFGQMQNDRYSRGIRQRRVYPDDIAAFLIPVLPNNIQEEIGKRVVKYELFNKIARELTQAANQDAEYLIEGTLKISDIMSGELRPPSWESIQLEIENQNHA